VTSSEGIENMNKWGRYLLWVVGMFILLDVVGRVENSIQRAEMTGFHVAVGALVDSMAVFALGIYLSVLFLQRATKINLPLFVCVFIPTTVFWVYIPVAMIVGLPVPFGIQPLMKVQLMPILSALSLMLSIFWGSR